MTPDEWDEMTDDEKADDLERVFAGIKDEIREETSKSRFRDGCSRGRIHPIANDVGRLIDFVAARRLRQPGVMNLLRRILHQTDTPAIRLLVEMVLTKGSCGWFMRRRCERLLAHCDQVEAAFALRGNWKG